jgi:regulator of RNase E activity RraA
VVVTPLERLGRLDACAVSDALDALGLAGVIDGVTCLTGLARVAGRAVTVELGPAGESGATGESGAAGESGVAGTASHRHLGTAAAEACRPGDVIVIAHQGRGDSAGWGGNLSRAARRNGAVGVVCDGAVRDVDEARDVGLPLWATGATPRTARGRTVERCWNEPVVLAGVRVAPGDYLVADSTGVVAIAASDIEAVLERAEVIAAKEAAMAAAIDAGVPVSEVMGAGYEAMLSPQAGVGS